MSEIEITVLILGLIAAVLIWIIYTTISAFVCFFRDVDKIINKDSD